MCSVAFLALLSIGRTGPLQEAQTNQEPKTLLNYIEDMKWNPTSKGPLLSIEPNRVLEWCAGVDGDGNKNEGLEAFGMRLAKVGGVSVLAPATEYDDPMDRESDSLHDLDFNLRVAALLANLSDSEFERLNQIGLCADELKGDARIALLSMLPRDIDVYQLWTDAEGGTHVQNEPDISSEADRVKIKFQICRAVQVELTHQTGPNSYEGGLVLNSLHLRRNDESHVARSNALESGSEVSREVEVGEKEYRFDWSNKALAQGLELKPDEPLEELVGRIRDLTHLEIYADARIGHLSVHSLGKISNCSSVLHALVLSANGVVRPVGPAFVIAESIEGAATASARRAGLRFLEGQNMAPLVSQWIREVHDRGFLKRISYLSGDSLAPSVKAPDESESERAGYLPIGALPPKVQSAVQEAMAERPPGEIERDETGQTLKLDRATIQSNVFTRWILPDGRPISESLFSDIPGVETGDEQSDVKQAQINASKLPKGSVVEISPSDATATLSMIKALTEHGFREIWLDTDDVESIAAALGTGCQIDLVIRPWRRLRNEALPSPDQNVLGLTGSQVAALPKGTLDPSSDCYPVFADTLSPSDAELADHWQRLLDHIPKSRIHRIIVLDPLIGGYTPPPINESYGSGTKAIVKHQFSFGPLVKQDPGINDFGYTLSQRLKFLRERHVDPIDLALHLTSLSSFGDGYWQGGSVFSDDEEPNKYLELWKAVRRRIGGEALAPLLEKLDALGLEICSQKPYPENDQSFPQTTVPQVEVAIGGKKALVSLRPIGPDYSLDANGNFDDSLDLDQIGDDPVCFDFRVPSREFDTYLNHYFAPVGKSSPSLKGKAKL